jgi:putative MATE family efflux protein
MSVITIVSVGIFMQVTFERLLQSTGKTIFNMITQGTGAIINIILDPIFIFGWFGLPKMGVTGAAVATVSGQVIAALLGVYFNRKFNKEIHVTFRGFKPCKRTIGAIYKIGVPSIIMQAIGSLTTFGMNKILLAFTSTAATVFGVYFKLQSFIFMPVFGLTNGMIPIVAYNYGAKNKKRIYQTIKLSVAIAVGIMLVGVLIFQLFPKTLLGLFEASDHMLAIGAPALRIISLSFVFAGFCITISCVFQALGNGIYSLIMSAARQILVILPVAYVFGELFGLNAVWYAYPIAEIVSVAVCIILLIRILNLKVRNLNGES